MNKNTTILIVCMFALLLVFILPLSIANTNGSNYKNVTVSTHVNITHSHPDVLNVSIYEAANYSAKNITVTAGSFKNVYCNVTVRSWEGYNDITKVNATLWHAATSSNDAIDNNNSHYVNSTCTVNASLTTWVGWYLCSFNVWYYANNGTWNCNATVSNSYTLTNPNFTGSGYNTTMFYPVYALNVTDGIDYGNAAVGDYTAPDVVANVTNLGNMNISISVDGYGKTRGDGLAMNCSLNGNINISNERFSLNNTASWDSMTNLTNTSTAISGFIIPKQTIPATYMVNSTYWRMYIDPITNPAGNCTGFIVFTAGP